MRKSAIYLTIVLVLCLTSGNAIAAHGPGGLAEIPLNGGQLVPGVDDDAGELCVEYISLGNVAVWNTRTKLQLRIVPKVGYEDGVLETWKVKKVHVFVGNMDTPIPVDGAGNPLKDQFPYIASYGEPSAVHSVVLDLEEDMGFRWGQPYEAFRNQKICVYAVLVQVDSNGKVLQQKDTWTFAPGSVVFEEDFDYDVIKIGKGRLKKYHKVKRGKNARKRMRVARGLIYQALMDHWGNDVYEMAHPRRAHFIDSPVGGLGFETPTHKGKTDDSGAFDYFPGERVDLYLGNIYLGDAIADHKISPVDVFEGGDMDDPRAVNMARLLQSLDADGDPSKGIGITESVVTVFETAMENLGMGGINFEEDETVEAVINETISLSAADSNLNLVAVSAQDAKAHLGKYLSTDMFRKNVSKTPDMASAKSKLNVMGVWFPALKANGDPATFTDENGAVVDGIPYYQYIEETETSELIRVAAEAKPLVVVYTDEVEGFGAADVFAAVSRDDGNTWKRKNISRMADRSSFQLANGEEYYGHCKKPVFHVKGNKIFIAWTSKFARGGKPTYSIRVCPDEDGDGSPDECETCTGSEENGTYECGPDYIYDDPYAEDDIWGVAGSQRSVDYSDEYPEVGEVPYSAVWTCRGVIVTQAEINKGGWWADKPIGEIVWFKPERLTSARRDANQVFCGGADGAGFAIAWQEDPKGLRPGEAKGPGPGWGGATANHKTDIWYSYITWGNHTKVDDNFVAGGDPNHPVQIDDETGEEIPWTNRPKALVPMSLPVRISDNDAVNTNNADLVDDDGNPITAVTAEDIVYEDENLTRCVKFVGGASMVTPDDPDAATADYAVLRDVPDNHNSSMNCTNCHVPYDTEPMGENPMQAAPIPLVVVNAAEFEYLGGFTNSDCLSCHYNNIVPRDRVIAVAPGSNEATKCAECESKGGTWVADLEAYYPYDPYPYIQPDLDDTKDGSHRYITEVPGLWSYTNTNNPIDGTGLYTKVNYQGAERTVAITTDGRLLDGNTSATRANLFLQTYKKPDGSKSAWAIMAYEETKGLGSGPPETTGEGSGSEDGSGYDPYEVFPDNGKNAIYHSFDFQEPDLVSGGEILNLPETNELGTQWVTVPKYLGSTANEDGTYTPIDNPDYNDGDPYLYDWKGATQLAYENARRPRFILQGKSAAGLSKTVLIVLYKEGEEGAGRPSDIMARRCVANSSGNPYKPANFVDGAQNLSTVRPGMTWINPDRDENAKGDGVKVCDWTQPEGCLTDKSGANPYEDARAHRGAIRGDFVIMGYSYCPNWAASRNAHDKYDFYIRRSFDGGETWTTDATANDPILHQDYFIDPDGVSGSELDEEGNDATEATKHYIVETEYSGGNYEPARNVSLLKNNKVSVIEPRIVAVPGTIKVAGAWTGLNEDKQDPNSFYIAYGTSTNLKGVEKAPEDLFLSYSLDRGNHFAEDIWVVNPDSSGNNAGLEVTGWFRLAKGEPEQGEVQIRMTPNAERFYACWLEEGAEGSDIFFRRMMPSEFSANVATPVETTTTVVDTTDDDSSYEDTADDSGGDDD